MGIVPSTFAGAQHWVGKCGGVGNERVVDVKADLADGLISIGEFGPGASVLGQPLTCQGLSDVFVVKQSASGALQWVQQAGGAGLDFDDSADALSLRVELPVSGSGRRIFGPHFPRDETAAKVHNQKIHR